MAAIKIDRPGIFRGSIVNYELLKVGNEKTVSFRYVVKIMEQWVASENNPEDGSWQDWTQYDDDYYAEGNLYIIGRNGDLNEKIAQRLVDAADWDGKFQSINNKTFKPPMVKITIEQEQSNSGELFFPIKWLNNYHDSVSGSSATPVDGNLIKNLDNQFGAKTKAMASSKQLNNQTPPINQPQAPVQSTGQQASHSVEEPPQDMPNQLDDDCPF